MNTNPDETKQAMWLDDELTGAELAEMDAWAATQPEQLAARENLRKFRSLLAQNIPAAEEPPYPDFFLSRVNQGIRDLQIATETPAKAKPTHFWKSWFMPMTACAGMVLAFTLGKQINTKESIITEIESKSITAPLVYTPEEGVIAEWVAAPKDTASVILLKGVAAIPDSTNFSETVYIPTARESDRTATLEADPSETSKQ